MIKSHSAQDALDWMHEQKAKGMALFRGQTRKHKSIRPTLFRDQVSEESRICWWRVRKRFNSAFKNYGIDGYRVPTYHDAEAMLQHYLGKSAVIDVTGTPEVALHFALLNQTVGQTHIVYAFDESRLTQAGLTVTDHNFLQQPLGAGGARHRWLRQDGYTIGCPYWGDYGGAGRLDLLDIGAHDSLEFIGEARSHDLVDGLGDLESLLDDPLATLIPEFFLKAAQAEGVFFDVSEMLSKS